MIKKNKRNVLTGILSKHRKGFGFVACDDIEKNYEFCDLVELKDGKVTHNSELTKKIILSIIDKTKI